MMYTDTFTQVSLLLTKNGFVLMAAVANKFFPLRDRTRRANTSDNTWND